MTSAGPAWCTLISLICSFSSRNSIFCPQISFWVCCSLCASTDLMIWSCWIFLKQSYRTVTSTGLTHTCLPLQKYTASPKFTDELTQFLACRHVCIWQLCAFAVLLFAHSCCWGLQKAERLGVQLYSGSKNEAFLFHEMYFCKTWRLKRRPPMIVVVLRE